ncbi:MAG: oligoendopeptidase F, partial [Maritimibacter sp.]
MRHMSLPFPLRDANASAGGSDELGALPEWDLSDLYTSPDAPEVARDLEWLQKACADFAAKYEGKLGDLDAAGMLECVQADEDISRVAGRLMSFAGLRYYQLTTDPERAQFLQNLQEEITEYSNALVFFSLE